MNGNKNAHRKAKTKSSAPPAGQPIHLQPFVTDYAGFVKTTRKGMGLPDRPSSKSNTNERIYWLLNLESCGESPLGKTTLRL